MPDVDDIDHELLRLLTENGRRTFSDLAGRIGLSVAATKRRVDRLRELGVITGFTAQIDHTKLGWNIEAFAEMRFTGTTGAEEIIRSAATMPEVQAVFTTAGDPDALIWLRVRDVHELRRIITKLRHAGNVTGTKTLMVLGSWIRDQP